MLNSKLFAFLEISKRNMIVCYTDFFALSYLLQYVDEIQIYTFTGGARGAAHVGMLKAVITEAGIPVDKIGGVSMGALVGGLWSQYRDYPTISQKTRLYFEYLGNSYVGPLLGLTYPLTSLFTGKYFNWTLTDTFGTDLAIEDLWLPFFCVSTDITISRYNNFQCS